MERNKNLNNFRNKKLMNEGSSLNEATTRETNQLDKEEKHNQRRENKDIN